MKTESRSLGRTALILTFIGLFGKGIGFLRELVFARYFGLSEDYEIYLVVSAFPFILITSFLYFWQNYLVPQYRLLKKENAEDHADFIRDSMLMSFFIALCISIVLYSFRGFFFGTLYAFHPNKIEMIDHLLLIILTALILNSLIMVFTAWHYAEQKFTASTLLLSVPSVSVIIITVFLSQNLGAAAIPVGLTAGFLIQLIILSQFNPEKIKLISGRPVQILSRLNSVFLFTLLIEVVGQLYIVVDRYFYRQIEAGGLAALNYAHTVYLLPITIISMALASVAFPSLAEAFANNDTEKIKTLTGKGIAANIYIFIPVTFFFYFNAERICILLFEGGAFTRSASITTASTLRLFAYSYIFYSIYSLLNRTIYSIGKAKVLFIITVGLVVLKFILNTILSGLYGVNGLALSTSIIYSTSFFAALFYLVSRKLVHISAGDIYALILSSVIGFISFYSASQLFGIYDNLNSKIGIGILLLCSGAVSVIVFYLLLWVSGGSRARSFLKELYFGLLPNKRVARA